MQFGSSTNIAGAALGALIFFGAGFLGGVAAVYEQAVPTPVAALLASQSDVPPEDVNLAPLWRAWKVLDEKFVPASTTETITNEKKLYGLIGGLAGSLGDPYTVFFPPEEAKIFQADISGSFEGVGMEIGIRDDTLTVVTPLQGSPALRAGLRAGDKILRINDVSTGGMAVDKAVKLIRGPRGTTVRFTVARAGAAAPLIIPVVRDIIEIPTIETSTRDGVFVISLYNFSAVSANLFRGALRDFALAGTPKLVLDLRGNPGGYLEAAVDMASWFLPAGKVVVTEEQGKNGEPRAHRSRGYDVFSDELQMVVLVNGGSASASEILAGALREHGVATLVGEKTFGKGSVQELVNITDDSSLKVTIARWVTPKGHSISEQGLEPDIVVKRGESEKENGKDSQLDAAIDYLNRGAGSVVRE